jgi:ribose transport system ATP-binding protein
VAEREVVLRVSGVSKTFPGTQALAGVDLDVRRGEIHALVGANGSGKSTLVKILAGIHKPDAGTVEVAADLHVVHQDPAVFPDLSVTDNLAIGRGFETDAIKRIRWRSVRRRTERILERFAIEARPDTRMGALRPAARTMVAIARALQDQEGRHQGVLVLDEPTTSLPDSDTTLLLEALRRYATAGQSMLFVTHELDEVFGFAERVTVLRDGRKVMTAATREIDRDSLVEAIAGRPLRQVYPGAAREPEEAPALEVRGLTATVARDVSLSVAPGEIVGLTGLVGSGADEILQCIFGASSPRSGTVTVNGKTVKPGRPKAALAAGAYYVPGERERALFSDLSVGRNLSAAEVGRYWGYFGMRRKRERRDARATIDRFGIAAASEGQPVELLSGGNQQKVVVARWLRRRPQVLLLEEPTRGVDVGARADIYGLIREAADDGAAVVLVSTDFDELDGLCDRVLVVDDGRIVDEVRSP